MEKELKEILKSILDEEFEGSTSFVFPFSLAYVKKIREALTDKIIDTIKYDFDNTIKESIEQLFSNRFNMELNRILEEEKENLENIFKERFKEVLRDVVNKIELDLSNYTFREIIKDNLVIKNDLKKEVEK
jgi:hypothetical protein